MRLGDMVRKLGQGLSRTDATQVGTPVHLWTVPRKSLASSNRSAGRTSERSRKLSSIEYTSIRGEKRRYTSFTRALMSP